MRLALRISGGIAPTAAVVFLLSILPVRAGAQTRNDEASALLTSAMDAYSNLELEKAKGYLDQALAFKDELDPETLAKVYIGFGVLWAGGYSNSVEAKRSFTMALCLDENVKVDPLFSTPEIDVSFTESRADLSSSVCRELGIAPAALEPCGYHEPFVDQRKGYELPFYLDVNPSFNDELDRIAVKYAFDGKRQYRTLNLESIGNGYGGMVECDSGEIRSVNPDSVQYFIEGYDSNNNVICSQGSEDAPLEVLMTKDVPIVSRPGLSPQACLESSKKGAGQSCSMTTECRDGLVCGEETFRCESKAEPTPTPTAEKGPRKFYVNLTGGAGFGYVNKDITIVRYDKDGNPATGTSVEGSAEAIAGYSRGRVDTLTQNPSGVAWSGVPIRLAFGYKINSKLSVEVSGRLDGFVISNSEPLSCWEYTGGNTDYVRGMKDDACTTNFAKIEAAGIHFDDSQIEELARNSEAIENGSGKTRNKYQIAWLVNARVRYAFLAKSALQMSVFGGLGYGHIQYRVKDSSSGDYYYPLPGMVNVEVGVGLSYYFSKHVGVIFDIPIDFAVGDGFALNFDFNLGLGFGF